MPAPTLEKTWQFNINQGLFFGATAAATHATVLRTIKNIMIGFGSNPWVVKGSSNSAASGMDDTDRWAADSNLVWGTGAHSWIVLRQTGIAAKFEICIDLNNSQTQVMTLVVSPVNGFGTANGGTNGTTSARPTATDEVVVQTTAQGWIWGASNQITWVHAQQSTDGQCTRVFVASNNQVNTFWMFDRVKNPLAGWTGTAAIFCAQGANGIANCIDYGTFFDTPNKVFARHSSTNLNFYLATVGWGNSAFGRSIAGSVLHDVTKEWPATPMSLWSEVATARGLWGNLYDIWWGTDDLNSLTTYEDGGVPHSFAQLGHMIFPWNGAAPPRMG